MGTFINLLCCIILLFIPKSYRLTVISKFKKCKEIYLGTPELRLFWKIFTPVIILMDFITASIKVLLVLLLPNNMHSAISYGIDQFFKDILSRRIGVWVGIKRFYLSYELLTKGAESHKSFGDLNDDIIIYIIRPYYYLKPNELIFRNVANLLTQYYYVLQKISYAVEKNYIPVVDWENWGNLPHSEEYPINGSKNSWEYYWEQPSNISLEDAYKSKNVILSTQNIGAFGYIPGCAMSPPFQRYAENLIDKCPKYAKYIPLNDKTINYIKQKRRELFPENKKILGVIVRGSSYGTNGTPYKSHPVQLNNHDLVDLVKKYMKEWDIEYIYFVNEVLEIVEYMKSVFGDKVIVLPRTRDSIKRPTDGSVLNPMYKDGQKYQTNLDYITEVALLSTCDSLIGGMSSGTRTALIWNADKYENIYIVDRGLW